MSAKAICHISALLIFDHVTYFLFISTPQIMPNKPKSNFISLLEPFGPTLQALPTIHVM